MYKIDQALCTGCGLCFDACQAGAIVLVGGCVQIDAAACIDCGSCARVCPQGAILLAEAYPVAVTGADRTAVRTGGCSRRACRPGPASGGGGAAGNISTADPILADGGQCTGLGDARAAARGHFCVADVAARGFAGGQLDTCNDGPASIREPAQGPPASLGAGLKRPSLSRLLISKGANTMPRGDRTGPMGAGPRTGRAAGWCAGYDRPGYANGGPGFGMGMGYGRGVRGYGRGGAGRGWRNMYYATGLPAWARGDVAPPPPPAPAADLELAELKAQAARLAESLDAIQKRIEEISGRGAAPADM